jgi:nucleotide sugar dehydrogenase
MPGATVVVVGQGYVGLPLAVRAAEAGYHVIGLDLDEGVVNRLNHGRSHIGDVSDAELRAAIECGYGATSESSAIAQADVVVVCVPTPLGDEGGPNLSAVRAAGQAIGQHVRPGTLVVLESTTYPGTTEEVFTPLVTGDGLTVGVDIFITFSPERVDPGNQHFGVRNTPKVVGGVTEACTERAVAFYERLVDTVVVAKSAREAEMAKLLENTFRHVNIALVNEMVRFCDDLDIDLWNAIDCAATKPFGFMPFRPGPGVGGHCIPIDPTYLSYRVKARLGYAFRMVELAEEVNGAAPAYVASRVWRALNERKQAVNGARVLLVGVSYKPDVSDQRQSPALPLAQRLLGWGAAVSYFDPFVPKWSSMAGDEAHMLSERDLEEAARASDIVVLLQPHAGIDLPGLAASAPCLLDTRGVVPEGPDVIRL